MSIKPRGRETQKGPAWPTVPICLGNGVISDPAHGSHGERREWRERQVWTGEDLREKRHVSRVAYTLGLRQRSRKPPRPGAAAQQAGASRALCPGTGQARCPGGAGPPQRPGGGGGGLDAGDQAPCKTEPLPYLSSRSAWKLGLGPVTESLAPGTATHLTRCAPAHKRLGGQACLDLTAEPIWNQPLTQPRAVVDAPGSTQPCPPRLPRGSLLPGPPPRSVSSLQCNLAGPHSHSP